MHFSNQHRDNPATVGARGAIIEDFVLKKPADMLDYAKIGHIELYNVLSTHITI